MSQRVVTMEQKLAAMFADVASGRSTVTQVCLDLGISRDTYYRCKQRFAEEGLAGLAPRSRAPLSSPSRTAPLMVEAIVTARKELEREGWDNGALSIESRLLHDGLEQVPAARTIHRVLKREGLVEPEPGKRPRSSYRRFVFPATDDCWQIDAFGHVLGDEQATAVAVFEIIDDHSRYNPASLAWPREDTEGAWTVMSCAIDRYGAPRMVLADNGLAFTGRRVSSRVLFEKNLAHLGIKLINSRPGHPQTNGKNERAHSTAQRWLRAQTPATTLAELQAQLEHYRNAYNLRPHQGIDRQTPLERRLAGTRPTPLAMTPIAHTDVISARASARDGYLAIQNTVIPLGIEYAGLPMTAFTTGDHTLVFHREQLVRELTLDRTRKRQAPHRPRHNTPTRRTFTYNPHTQLSDMS